MMGGNTAFWAFGVVTCLAALTAAIEPSVLPVWTIQLLVSLLAVWTLFRRISPVATPELLNPLFLLSMMGLVLYVWAPLVYRLLDQPFYVPADMHARNMSVATSHAQLLVLQFISICLLTANLIVARRPGLANAEIAALPPDRSLRVVGGALSIALACAIMKFAAHKADIPLGPVRAMLPPITYFCLATAALFAIRASWRTAVVTIILTTVSIFLFIASDLARVPLAFAAFVILMSLAQSSVPGRKLILFACAVFTAVVLMAGLANIYRHIENRGAELSLFRSHLVNSIAGKLLIRQTVSEWCLEQARARHWDKATDPDYLNFLSGLVPRALWPDKPNLSRGAEYAVEYCNAKVDPKKPHSEALTLLAEPIMEGGAKGLFVGEALILAFVGLLSMLMMRTGAAGIVTGTAMLPWLTAFEEHLVYYLANCTKMLLIMLPFAIVLWWLLARARKAGPR